MSTSTKFREYKETSAKDRNINNKKWVLVYHQKDVDEQSCNEMLKFFDTPRKLVYEERISFLKTKSSLCQIFSQNDK